jgi:hypothetical protein
VDATRDYYQELDMVQASAKQVQDGLARLAQLPAASTPLVRGILANAMRLARDLAARARAPISIGLVGEYSVGKSRLMNTLLGLPGLLPVSSQPTTGNITALRVKAARPGQPTGPLSASVSYMSHQELSGVARFILDKLQAVISENRLGGYDIGAVRGSDPVTDGWEGFEALARSWWPDAPLKLRLHAWELLRLRDAMLVGAQLIPERSPSAPIAVEIDVVREAIEIRDSRTTLPPRFPERSMTPPIPPGDALTPETLRATFPLIRRLTYDVAIDPGLLRLNGLRDSNGLELLDFAGLNAAGGARDELLCRWEVAQVTTYLALVRADHPETDAITEFEAMLEGSRRSTAHLAESRFLVANAFDEIALPSPERVAQRGVADASEQLDSLVRIATALDPGLERVALTSTMPELVRPEWSLVADALAAGDPGPGAARLTAALRGYAADGGIERLRNMLSDHIGAKALPIIVAELAALRAELCAELARLRDLVAPPGTASSAESDLEVLLGMIKELADIAEEAKAMAKRCGDVEKIPVAAGGSQEAPEGTGLMLERIRGDAVRAVYAWPQWTAIFSHVQGSEVKATAAGGPRPPAPGPRGPGSGSRLDDLKALNDLSVAGHARGGPGGPVVKLPQVTNDFSEPFSETLAALRAGAATMARDVVQEWVDDLYQRHAGLRTRLADPRWHARLAERVEAAYPGAGSVRMKHMDFIRDLDWILDVLDESLRSAEAFADRPGNVPFPLAPDHALPWSVARGPLATPESRHVSRVHRMRHDLAEGVAFPVQSIVGMAFGVFRVQAEAQLNRLRSHVPNQAELRAATVAAPAPAAADDEAVVLLDTLLADACTATTREER